MELHQLDRPMKRLLPFLAIFLLGAAPSRTQTYTSGQVISPSAVTENEDNIFSYLQGGVDTYDAGSVTSAAILDGTITSSDLGTDAVTSASILANTVNGTDIALGSDTQGDIMYYNGTDWARLGYSTSGFFLKTQGIGANPTWASATLTSQLGTFTVDTTTASGTQAVTGVGFQPNVVIFLSVVATGTTAGASVGFDNGTTHYNLYNYHANTANTWSGDASSSIQNIQGAGTNYNGSITTLGSDGFTITWVKTGSPSGTLTVYYLAVK